MYMDIAARVAAMSHAVRKKVGAVITKNDNIISYGWNGTPAGGSNVCEITLEDGSLETKREVLHAESNAISKLAENGGVGAQGATLYTTWSPCFECSKLIRQAKIRRVVFRNQYRDGGGIDFLRSYGVDVIQLQGGTVQAEPARPTAVPTPVAQPIKPTPPPSTVRLESEVPVQPAAPTFIEPTPAELEAMIRQAAGTTPLPQQPMSPASDNYRSSFL